MGPSCTTSTRTATRGQGVSFEGNVVLFISILVGFHSAVGLGRFFSDVVAKPETQVRESSATELTECEFAVKEKDGTVVDGESTTCEERL